MIDKGSFVRKRNWEFFTNYYLSGKAEYVPSIEIISIIQSKPNNVSIHGLGYRLDELVEITREEHIKLNEEFSSMKLVSSLNDEFCHFRKDNGAAKIAQNIKDVFLYCFTFNHKEKNKGFKMSAYVCPVCCHIHCGTQVEDQY